MVRVLLASAVCCIASSEEVSSLLQTRANNDLDCTRKNKCQTSTTTTVAGTCEDWYADNENSCYDADMEPSGRLYCGAGTCTQGECCKKTTTTTTTAQTCADYRARKGCPNMEPTTLKTCRGVSCSVQECCQATTTTTPSFEKKVEKPPPPRPTTTTTTTNPLPPKNCLPPKKSNPQFCHFWGEPHFTSIFFDHNRAGHNVLGHRGGRVPTNYREMEFHETGVFTIAKAHGHEVQAFFCEGPRIDWPATYDPTSSACGLAIKMKDGATITLTRNPRTKAQRSDKWTNEGMMKAGNSEVLQISVNGEEKSWFDLSENGLSNGRGVKATGDRVPKGATGTRTGANSYISQMVVTSPKEAKMATAPLCVGDADRNFTVDVSVALMDFQPGNPPSWPLVYEMSVSVLAAAPEQSGLCGDKTAQNLIKTGKNGYFPRGSVSQHRVPAAELLFSSKEMSALCDACDTDCTSFRNTRHLNNHAGFCNSKNVKGQKLIDIRNKCNALGEHWRASCMIEECATNGHGEGLVAAEAEFEDYIKKQTRR